MLEEHVALEQRERDPRVDERQALLGPMVTRVRPCSGLFTLGTRRRIVPYHLHRREREQGSSPPIWNSLGGLL